MKCGNVVIPFDNTIIAFHLERETILRFICLL